MIALSAGSFMMGSADGDASERPVHRVTLGAFALGRTAVTAKLWMACVGDGGCAYRPRTDLPDTAPMNNLSWEDARHYVDWLAKTTGNFEHAGLAGSGRVHLPGPRRQLLRLHTANTSGVWCAAA